jgi:3-hydroxyisobutyrate dehydrogenase-like beta-hydroxyacid dehydrogenase
MGRRIAFIGLGVMGSPMAGWLAKHGHLVTVYNRTTSVAQTWIDTYGGQIALTPAEAAKDAEFVLICVGNDNDVREVMSGDNGVFSAVTQGTVIIDHTTTSANLSEQLAAEALQHQCYFMDAPVSGGQQGAENGHLTVMCGGDEKIFERVSDTVRAYAKAVTLLGPVGSGQLCKMVNQICIAGVVQGLAEGLNFARRAGLDAYQVVDVISQGAAQSWQMENRYQTMLAGNYEHGFAVQWMRKDLAFALEEAERNGSVLPVTQLVDQFYAEVQEMGGDRWDTSSLLARLVPE